jgi:transcriptional regulator with PAS, ATPase and Fis domain
MSEARLLSPADLGLERRELSGRHLLTLEQCRVHAERQAISSALRRNNENVTKAAHELGVSRMTLYRLIEKLQLANPEPSVEAKTTGTRTQDKPPARKPR